VLRVGRADAGRQARIVAPVQKDQDTAHVGKWLCLPVESHLGQQVVPRMRHRLRLKLDQVDRPGVSHRLVDPVRPALQCLEGQRPEHIIAREPQPRGQHAKGLRPGGEEFVDDLIGLHCLIVVAPPCVSHPASIVSFAGGPRVAESLAGQVAHNTHGPESNRVTGE
jgi:hypothetical protein